MDPNDEITMRSEYPDLRRMPGTTAIAVATVVFVAMATFFTWIACCGGLACAAGVCSPYILGVIVGMLGYVRPIRGAILIFLFGLAMAILCLLGVWYWIAVLLTLYALPLIIIGSLCASTLRRYVRGRHAQDALAPSFGPWVALYGPRL